MHIAILDWDDTIMPTTYLQMLQKEGKTPNYETFQEISQNIKILMLKIKEHCDKVIILTNAGLSWIYTCFDKYLDCEVDFKHVEIFSTYDMDCQKGQIYTWKLRLMPFIAKLYFLKKGNHRILCIGDHVHDAYSSLYLKRINPEIHALNILLEQKSKISKFIAAQNNIINNVENILTTNSNCILRASSKRFIIDRAIFDLYTGLFNMLFTVKLQLEAEKSFEC